MEWRKEGGSNRLKKKKGADKGEEEAGDTGRSGPHPFDVQLEERRAPRLGSSGGASPGCSGVELGLGIRQQN